MISSPSQGLFVMSMRESASGVGPVSKPVPMQPSSFVRHVRGRKRSLILCSVKAMDFVIQSVQRGLFF